MLKDSDMLEDLAITLAISDVSYTVPSPYGGSLLTESLLANSFTFVQKGRSLLAYNGKTKFFCKTVDDAVSLILNVDPEVVAP